MKKCIFILALSLIWSINLEWDAIAQMPKEGTFSGTVTYAGTSKVFPIDKEHFVSLSEYSGVNVDNSGGGPFHNVACHGVAMLYFEKGVTRLTSYWSITDKDGDKVLWELTETEGKPPNPVNGIGKIIWGTGKFTGIQGSYEYTRQGFRPATEGTFQAISKNKGTWKLP
jgi:hypothetical protein